MTRQEEIREGVANISPQNCAPMTQGECDTYVANYGETRSCDYCHADQVLKYLGSRGVVIRSDYTVKYSVPIQAGTELVLVEPLIKEE